MQPTQSPSLPMIPEPNRLSSLTAVLVNHRRWLDTARCIQLLELAGLPAEQVIVVDTASGDDSVTRLASRLPAGNLLSLPDNAGFAGGSNAGISTALVQGAQAVLLLNTDTVFRTDFLARLTGDAADLTGMCVSPEIFWSSAPSRTWFAGAWRGRLPGTLRLRHSGDAHTAVDYLWACCLLVGRAVWEAVGFLHPRFFLYYEDMAWCDRARRAGFDLRVVPAARLWHAVGSSTGGQDSPLRRYHLTRSSVLFFNGHGPAAVALRCLVDARTAAQLAAAGRADLVKAHLLGCRDGWRTVVSGKGSTPQAIVIGNGSARHPGQL